MAKIIDLEYKKLEKDLDRYSPALTIAQAAKEKNNSAMIESARYFIENLGVSKEDAEILMPKRPESLEDLVKSSVSKFQKTLGSAKLKDLRNYYSGSFEKFYTPENLKKVDEVFDSEDTYEKVRKKYEKVKEIVESETGNFTDEQKEKAKKDLKKLEKIIVPLESFKELKVDEAMRPYRIKSLEEGMNAAYEESNKEKKAA